MIKGFREVGLFFLVFLLAILIFTTKVEAFSFNFNPLGFLQKSTNVIIDRTSDLISYLIMQKRYIFNHYNDPNNYPNIDLADTNNLISTSSASTTNIVKVSIPTPIATSTVLAPKVEKPVLVVTPSFSPSLPVNTNPVSVLVPINDTYDIPVVYNGNNPDILNYSNKERSKFSLNSLIANSVLDEIASLRADDLFSNQYFEHVSPDGKSASDLAKKLGYRYLYIGENLAQGDFSSEKEIVSAWMASPGHRENILNDKYKELGVSVREGIFDGEKTTIAVQIFATPLSSCPKPNPEIKKLIDTSTANIIQKQKEAQIMFNVLETMKTNNNIDRTYYYQKIQEYNYFAKTINDAVDTLKGIIDSYNLSVAKYNSCLKS
jgi:uncharacterized protein YkwD